MQRHNVPEFIAMLRERKYPIDGMRMEVIDESDGCVKDTKGIITMIGEDHFSLKWCRRHCFLACLSHFRWKCLFCYLIPYCMGFRSMEPFDVQSERGKTLQVTMLLK